MYVEFALVTSPCYSRVWDHIHPAMWGTSDSLVLTAK
jgi:hypothetical protein